MSRKRPPKKRRPVPKTILRLPDLHQAKSAVLNSLSSRDSQRGYRRAIDEFIELVLLRAETIVQQNRGRPLSHAPGIPEVCTRDRQSAPWGRAEARLRGGRLRSP